jgi:hypothetical protein
MKIIAFEEHYTLPAIADAHPNSPRKLFDVSRGRVRRATVGSDRARVQWELDAASARVARLEIREAHRSERWSP